MPGAPPGVSGGEQRRQLQPVGRWVNGCSISADTIEEEVWDVV
jgi:hypothetical protein